MAEEKISIALATCNGERFLAMQLDSILAQKTSPYEVVVSDDNSSDGTVSLLSDFASSSPFPVKILFNSTRLGYRDNFMKAASACSGDLIAFCDQDDVWYENKLSKILEAFKVNNTLLVYHNSDLISQHGDIYDQVYNELRSSALYAPLSLSPLSFPFGFSIVFRRHLLKYHACRDITVDMYETSKSLAHDEWIFCLATGIGQVYYEAERLVAYRQHDDNLFGVSRHPASKIERLFGRFYKFNDYKSMLLMSDSLSKMFEAMASNEEDSSIVRKATLAAAWYADMASAYHLRTRSYSAVFIWTRFFAWLKLISDGRYGKYRQITFANKGMIRDFVLGVIAARLRSVSPKLSANDESLRVRP